MHNLVFRRQRESQPGRKTFAIIVKDKPERVIGELGDDKVQKAVPLDIGNIEGFRGRRQGQ